MTDLRGLSDTELVDTLRALESRQRETMAAIVAHLIEIEARSLHLRFGYSSLFDYCQRALGLSEDEAYRRTTVSRLARKWPAILDGLAGGSLHMSGVLLLKPYLAAENCDELLALARDASRRQLERRLAARFPRSDAAESVRAQRIKPLAEVRFSLQLTIGAGTRERLERALELMSHANPSRNLETVIDQALEVLVCELERTRRAKTKRSTGPATRAGERKRESECTRRRELESGAPPATRRRAIARPIRRQVFERDGDQCTFVGENGERCTCRVGLELDHIRPWARGGSSSEANLRVLCSAHNRFAAEECFGREHIRGARATRRGG